MPTDPTDDDLYRRFYPEADAPGDSAGDGDRDPIYSDFYPETKDN